MKNFYNVELKAKIRFEILSDFTNKMLKNEFFNQKIKNFLITMYFTKSDDILLSFAFLQNVNKIILLYYQCILFFSQYH